MRRLFLYSLTLTALCGQAKASVLQLTTPTNSHIKGYFASGKDAVASLFHPDERTELLDQPGGVIVVPANLAGVYLFVITENGQEAQYFTTVTATDAPSTTPEPYNLPVFQDYLNPSILPVEGWGIPSKPSEAYPINSVRARAQTVGPAGDTLTLIDGFNHQIKHLPWHTSLLYLSAATGKNLAERYVYQDFRRPDTRWQWQDIQFYLPVGQRPLIGDLDNDGKITENDLHLVAYAIEHFQIFFKTDRVLTSVSQLYDELAEPAGFQLRYEWADANSDGYLDNTDLAIIQKLGNTRKFIDVNGDGMVNADDAKLIEQITWYKLPSQDIDFDRGTSQFEAADLNSDGRVDYQDLTAWQNWVAAFGGPYGDANGDGQVTISDVQLLLSVLIGKLTMADIRADLADVNADGKFSAADVNLALRIALGLAKPIIIQIGLG